MRALLYLFVPILFLFGSAALTAAAEPQGEKPVEVRLTEYTVDMPHTLPAGPTTFLIRNEGKNTHSFRIEGPGIAEMLSAPVRPRKEASLQVTLQPGDYKVYCPVGSHESKGMTMTLTVAAKKP
jgi:plastocyanin